MTREEREEAIEYLNTLYMALAVFPNQQISLGNVDEMKESVSMAIEALEQKPKTIQEIQAESEKYQKAFEDGYEQGYAQARFDYEQEPCEDAISRQDVLDQTYLWSKDEFLRITNPFDYLRKRINDLPSVNPQEPKTGH